MEFPEGETYLARTDYSGELPPIYRVTVADGLVTGEHYDPHQDAWVDSVEIRKLRMNMSDHDFAKITPRLAAEIVEKRRRARR